MKLNKTNAITMISIAFGVIYFIVPIKPILRLRFSPQYKQLSTSSSYIGFLQLGQIYSAIQPTEY
ncbi:MAG: hypothetical protein V3S04_02835 [Candidatus Omnitrophota bacterium]